MKKLCQNCGNEFDGRLNRLYCTNKCRVSAFYNGNNAKNSQIVTDNLLNDKSVKHLTNFEKKSIEQLIPITIMLSKNEHDALAEQAEYCGVELSKFVRIRCQMDETDTSRMEATIEKQRSEIEDLKVKQSFYKNGFPQIQAKQSNQAGILIEMNQKQKDFIIEKWLESFDYDNGGSALLSNGSYTSSDREWYEDFEREKPGSIMLQLKGELLKSFFDDVEKRLIEFNNYDEEELQDNPLIDEYESLGK